MCLCVLGVCSTASKVQAQIILAGDPKQLGPVVQSQIAKHFGYG